MDKYVTRESQLSYVNAHTHTHAIYLSMEQICIFCGNTHEFSRVTQVYARVYKCGFWADIQGSFANIKVSFAKNPMDLFIHHQCFLSSVRLECMLECTGEFFGRYTGLFCEYTGLFCPRFYLPIG